MAPRLQANYRAYDRETRILLVEESSLARTLTALTYADRHLGGFVLVDTGNNAKFVIHRAPETVLDLLPIFNPTPDAIDDSDVFRASSLPPGTADTLRPAYAHWQVHRRVKWFENVLASLTSISSTIPPVSSSTIVSLSPFIALGTVPE